MLNIDVITLGNFKALLRFLPSSNRERMRFVLACTLNEFLSALYAIPLNPAFEDEKKTDFAVAAAQLLGEIRAKHLKQPRKLFYLELISTIFSLANTVEPLVYELDEKAHLRVLAFIKDCKVDNIFEYNPLLIIRLGKSITNMIRHQGSINAPSTITDAYGKLLVKITDLVFSDKLIASSAIARHHDHYQSNVEHEIAAFQVQLVLLKAPRNTAMIEPLIDAARSSMIGYAFANNCNTVSWLDSLDGHFDQASSTLDIQKEIAVDLYLRERDFNKSVAFETDALMKSNVDIHTNLGHLFRMSASTKIGNALVNRSPQSTGYGDAKLVKAAIADVLNSRWFYSRSSPPWMHGVGLWHVTAGAGRFLESRMSFNADRNLAEAASHFKSARGILTRTRDFAKASECNQIAERLDRRNLDGMDNLVLAAMFDEVPGRGRKYAAEPFVGTLKIAHL